MSIQVLNTALLKKVFSFLSIKDFRSIIFVCKPWKIALDDDVWKVVTRAEFGVEMGQLQFQTLLQLYGRLEKALNLQRNERWMNLRVLLTLELTRNSVSQHPLFSPEETFSLLFRFHKQFLDEREKQRTNISRKFNSEEQILLLKTILFNSRMKLVTLNEKLSHVAGTQNEVSLAFLEAHSDIFSCAEASNKKQGSELSTWVFLKANVQIRIEKKPDDVVEALKQILKKRKMQLKTLRFEFESRTGFPFGNLHCGSLTSFLHKYPQVFNVQGTLVSLNNK
jgi:hypothetical protein